MQTIKAIGLETQLDSILFGESKELKKEVNTKVVFTLENADKIISINGAKVYDVIVDIDSKNIHYNLKPMPEVIKSNFPNTKTRTYYYPIQYANIQFKKS